MWLPLKKNVAGELVVVVVIVAVISQELKCKNVVATVLEKPLEIIK